MPRFKCCRQTFLNKISLQEHIITHPPTWGKGNQNGSVQNRVQSKIVSPIMTTAPPFATPPPPVLTPEIPLPILTPPPTPSPSLLAQSLAQIVQPQVQVESPQCSLKAEVQNNSSSRKRRRGSSIEDVEQRVESELKLDPNQQSWKEWNCALGTLFEERSRLADSHADAFYWDLAMNTLVSLRNSYCCQQISKSGKSPGASPHKRVIVPVEEHNETIQKIGEITQEKIALQKKWEESETRRRVLEQIEKQYKSMLSVRTEEVLKVKKILRSSPEKGSLQSGLTISNNNKFPQDTVLHSLSLPTINLTSPYFQLSENSLIGSDRSANK